MRQTNAVWVTFLTGAAILQDLLHPAPSKDSRSLNNRESATATGHAAAAAAGGGGGGARLVRSNKQPHGQQQQQQQQHSPGPVAEVWLLLGRAWQRLWPLLSDYRLLLLLPVGFCIFVAGQRGHHPGR